MHHLPGLEMSTGSLGQGFSAAVGMALAAKMDKADWRVYTILGDGEIQEGEVWEAAMLAANHGLNNLVALVDNNNLQIDGAITDVNSPYPIDEKFKAFRWHVINIDGHDFDKIRAAYQEAREVKDRPVCIVAKTVKGKGVSFMENQVGWHGKSTNAEEYKVAMQDLERIGEELCRR
jgi:transketolase